MYTHTHNTYTYIHILYRCQHKKINQYMEYSVCVLAEEGCCTSSSRDRFIAPQCLEVKGEKGEEEDILGENSYTATFAFH